VKNELKLPAEVALALAIYDAGTLDDLDKLAEAIAASDDRDEVEALLRIWCTQMQFDAQRLFSETLEEIDVRQYLIH
jgi:hypothetical protein